MTGTTIHSALDLPVAKRKYHVRRGESLMNMQNKLKNVQGLIIDELSMLRAKEVYYIDLRLKQIQYNNRPFSGLCVLVYGDPGQLPPVAGTSVWEYMNNLSNENQNGYVLFRNVQDVVHLNNNLRLDQTDSNAVYLNGCLCRLGNGEVSTADYDYVPKTCCRHFMASDMYELCGFNTSNVSKAHCTNHKCNQDNLSKSITLNKPILNMVCTIYYIYVLTVKLDLLLIYVTN